MGAHRLLVRGKILGGLKRTVIREIRVIRENKLASQLLTTAKTVNIKSSFSEHFLVSIDE